MPRAVDEIVAEIEGLPPQDRRRVIRHIVQRTGRTPRSGFPGVVKTPDVCGGTARIIRTRIPVWTLERMRQLNISESDILRSYPSLRAIDLVQAWGYAETHAEEITQQIRENEED